MENVPDRIDLEEWCEKMSKIVHTRLAATKIPKDDLNRLVLNFLVTEGHKTYKSWVTKDVHEHQDTAEKFAQDARLQVDVDMASIAERMEIRSAVQGGDMDKAMEKLNDLNPEILESNPALLFRIKQQRLIEFIRAGSITEAVEFVQDELPQLCESDAELLNELETTLALLAFDAEGPCAGQQGQADKQPLPCAGAAGKRPQGADDEAQRQAAAGGAGVGGASSDAAEAGAPAAPGCAPPQALQYLLDSSQRHKTAAHLNAAILASQAQDKESKLPLLLKMLLWIQEQLTQGQVVCPQVVGGLVRGELELCAPEPAPSLQAMHSEQMDEEMLDMGTG